VIFDTQYLKYMKKRMAEDAHAASPLQPTTQFSGYGGVQSTGNFPTSEFHIPGAQLSPQSIPNA
jgi:hypothetical protein